MDNTSVKPGIKIVKKAVDNLDPNCTQALLMDYLLASDVEVLSCYSAKSWLRGEEKEHVSAFLVCVPASQRHKIFDPDLWSEGVIIREWQFKNSGNGRQKQD